MEVDTQTQKMEIEKRKSPELKHLGFAWFTVIKLMILVWKLYKYAKENSGSLRSTVEAVERAVTAVVAPVCEKYKDVPDKLLVYADRKVDEGVQHFNKHAPPTAKKAATKAKEMTVIALEKAEKLLHETREGGFRAAIIYTISESKHLTIQQTVSLYIKLDQHPAVHTILAIALPTAAHWSELYNKIVTHLTQKGYQVFEYVPLVPIDDITKAYKQKKPENKEDVKGHESDSSSGSD